MVEEIKEHETILHHPKEWLPPSTKDGKIYLKGFIECYVDNFNLENASEAGVERFLEIWICKSNLKAFEVGEKYVVGYPTEAKPPKG